MNQPRLQTNRDEVQKTIARASEKLYTVAKTAYGPRSGNVILGFQHGAPMLSHDGITNIKLVQGDDPYEDDIIEAIKQVSEKNNQKAGDGTTAVTILTHHLLMAAQKMEGKGINPRDIVSYLKEAERKALHYIDIVKLPIDSNDDTKKVATISAGDAELGALIADVMNEVGNDGGVVIEAYEGLGVHPEVVDGFYFSRGYKDTDLINDPSNNQSDHRDVPILISSQKFATEVDIAPVLQKVVDAGIKELIIIADTADGALKTLKMTKSKGILMGVPIDPPFVSGGRSLFLDDIAIMVGAKVYDGVDFEPDVHLGFAKEVLITNYSTTVIGGDSDKKIVKKRIEELRKQVKEADHPQSIQFAKDRLARLSGKMAIIKVGGALEFEREELKLRIQDAVCAVQSAMKEGIVPGGGATLARVNGTQFDDAFKQPFRQLMENAGLNPGDYLGLLKTSGTWDGFNLVNMTDEPVNLLENGVIDAALVQKEVVRNSISIVSGLITAGAHVRHGNKE